MSINDDEMERDRREEWAQFGARARNYTRASQNEGGEPTS